jgi:hypothetical protein
MHSTHGLMRLCDPARQRTAEDSTQRFCGALAVGEPMTRLMSRQALRLAQVGIVASCVWVFAGELDGAALTEIVGVPALLAAWAAAFALIDRWVMKCNH